MMPALGNYAVAVLGSYAATFVLIAAIVGLSLWQGAQVRRNLRSIEQRQERDLG